MKQFTELGAEDEVRIVLAELAALDEHAPR